VLILAGLLTQSIQYWVVIFNVRSADMLYRPEPEERRRVRYRLRSAPMQVAQQFLAALARDWDSPLDALRDHLDRSARGPAGPRSPKPEGIMTDHGFTTVATARTAATAAALAATLGLAAASWVIAVWQMRGMDMGTATQLGPFGAFIAVWVVMMAAMMLPGTAPAVRIRAQASGGVRAVPLFIGSYLAAWALVGTVAYALYRPHGPVAAGVVVIAASVYEFTPLKRDFRRRCRDRVRSGLEFGLCCVGSSAGLMAMLAALGVMSVTWMSVIALLVLGQKLLPPKAAIDVALALAIAGLGVAILIAPSQVPGFTPPM